MNLESYFEDALTYDEYVSLLGENLNLHNRHYDRFIISGDQEKEIKSIKPLKIIVLTEPWCGDSLAIFPVVRKIAEKNGNWVLKVILRDSHPELMNQFLTGGGRAIPIFLFLTEDYNLFLKWGPRPQAARQIFEEHRQLILNGTIEKSAVMKKIRNFYSRDRGREIIRELLTKLRENID